MNGAKLAAPVRAHHEDLEPARAHVALAQQRTVLVELRARLRARGAVDDEPAISREERATVVADPVGQSPDVPPSASIR